MRVQSRAFHAVNAVLVCFLWVRRQLADQLTEIVTDAVLAIRRPGEPIDLHMVERMHVRI